MVPKINQDGLERKNSIHQYYMGIINCMPGIVYWIDMDCLLQGCNSHFVEFLHLTSIKDLVGTPYDQMIKKLPWSKAQVKSFKLNDMAVLFSGDAQYDVEEPPIYDQDGKETYYQTTRIPLFDNDKHVIGLVVTLTNITIQKKLEQQLHLTKPTEKPKKRTKQLGAPVHVLIVEDDMITQTIEQALLVKLNCKVDIAESGEAAIKLFSPGKYDLVFMDIGLADTSGYIVSKTIRKMEKNTTHHVPIIALTSYQAGVVEYDCKDYFMDEVFTKPLTSEQAIKIIKHFVYHDEE